MKYLKDYTEEAMTAAFDKAGAFFAFGTKQFNEAKKEGVKYLNLGSGLICPIGNEKELYDSLDNIHKAGIAKDIEENGIEAIIKRELYNYECFYTYSIDEDIISELKQYGIEEKQIREVFNKEKENADCC